MTGTRKLDNSLPPFSSLPSLYVISAGDCFGTTPPTSSDPPTCTVYALPLLLMYCRFSWKLGGAKLLTTGWIELVKKCRDESSWFEAFIEKSAVDSRRTLCAFCPVCCLLLLLLLVFGWLGCFKAQLRSWDSRLGSLLDGGGRDGDGRERERACPLALGRKREGTGSFQRT